MKKKKGLLISVAAAAAATLWIICASVALTVAFRPLYYGDIEALSIPEQSGYSEEEIRENYDVLIDYNLIGGPKELRFPTLAMSETGRIHFEEVKRIFIFAQWFAIVGAACFAVWIILYIKGRARDIRWLKFTGPVTGAAAAVCGLGALIDWQATFTAMHRILFRNDYWIFDAATDPVIKILPEGFFFHCGMMIVALVLVGVTAVEAAYFVLRKRNCK